MIDRLITEAKAGSADALDRVIELLSEHLWIEINSRQYRRGLGPSHSVSDLIQDTLLRVRNGFTKFERASFADFKQWAKAILFRRWQELSRNHQSRTNEDQKQKIWSVLSSRPVLDVADALEIKDEADKAFSIFKQLRPHEQAIIHLRLFNDLKYREIAEATAGTEASVRMAYDRAIEQLRHCFESSNRRT